MVDPLGLARCSIIRNSLLGWVQLHSLFPPGGYRPVNRSFAERGLQSSAELTRKLRLKLSGNPEDHPLKKSGELSRPSSVRFRATGAKLWFIGSYASYGTGPNLYYYSSVDPEQKMW